MMNGFNQYICEFCQNPCVRSNKWKGRAKEFSNKCRWRHCDSCRVYYAVHPTGRVLGKKIYSPDPGENDAFYQIEINYKRNHTRIAYMTKKTEFYLPKRQYLYQELLNLDSVIDNVSPSNAQQKIKTYLLFS